MNILVIGGSGLFGRKTPLHLARDEEVSRVVCMDFGITTKHYSEVITEQVKASKFKFPDTGQKVKVTLHDSCHIGRVSSVYDAPRDFIKAIPGVEFVEMEHNREETHCCGSVLAFIKDPPVAAEIEVTDGR